MNNYQKYQNKYRLNHKEYYREYMKDYYKDPINKAKRNKQRKETIRKLKVEVFNVYGGKCNCCGEKEISFLSIDHIYGRGKEHKQTINVCGTQFYYWLKKNNYPKEYQCLCHNCNHGKFINGGICPHREKKMKK